MAKSSHCTGMKSFRVKEEGREKSEEKRKANRGKDTGQRRPRRELPSAPYSLPCALATLTPGKKWVNSAYLEGVRSGNRGRIREPEA